MKTNKGILNLSNKGLSRIPELTIDDATIELDVSVNKILLISDSLLKKLLDENVIINAWNNAIPSEYACILAGRKYAIMVYEVISMDEAIVETRHDTQDYADCLRLEELGIKVSPDEFSSYKKEFMQVIDAYPDHRKTLWSLCKDDRFLNQIYNNISTLKLRKNQLIL